MAINMIDSVKAVATIGSPADPQHVQRLFQHSLQEIKASGQALVDIGGRPFIIKKQFLDDISDREIKLTGTLDHVQKERMLEIANKCPVHKTLYSQVQIRTKLYA
jgi:uncharacterized OsmC-like protein